MIDYSQTVSIERSVIMGGVYLLFPAFARTHCRIYRDTYRRELLKLEKQYGYSK